MVSAADQEKLSVASVAPAFAAAPRWAEEGGPHGDGQ